MVNVWGSTFAWVVMFTSNSSHGYYGLDDQTDRMDMISHLNLLLFASRYHRCVSNPYLIIRGRGGHPSLPKKLKLKLSLHFGSPARRTS